MFVVKQCQVVNYKPACSLVEKVLLLFVTYCYMVSISRSTPEVSQEKLQQKNVHCASSSITTVSTDNMF